MTEENKVQFEQECKNILVELGLAQLSEIRKIQPLTGGCLPTSPWLRPIVANIALSAR